MQALIVDDSSTMRKVLKSILIGAGFEVSEAKCGADALDCLKQQRADLALFDWNMPEMTGIELLGKVRSDPSHAAMKIMMVTTESEQSEVERALREGADEYVMKPFTRDIDSQQAADHRIHPMKYRVLVVDDSVVMRRIVRQSLESDPEIEVVALRQMETSPSPWLSRTRSTPSRSTSKCPRWTDCRHFARCGPAASALRSSCSAR